MSELPGRVALVTGGSRGIGRAVALALAEAGPAVAVNYRQRAEEANAVVGQIQEHGGRAAAFAYNAGIAASHGGETTEEEFDRTLAINLKSAFLCTEAVVPGMRARYWGRIVNLSAMGARAGSRSVAYGAAKAGLEGLTRSYALQLAAAGITVNAVAPGLIDTEMTRALLDDGTALGRIPAGRPGSAAEIAEVVLLAVRNGYLTGQTLAVNGGAWFG